MFKFLLEVNQRPEPFAEYTARELWTDPHTSKKMLAYHLNETVDAASRNHAFLDRSAEWIVSHFRLESGARVADFGCGPGLYAQRLATRGLDVTGIDFSANSLEYARKQASDAALSIEYIEADYLGFETDRRFDLVMMIMCDFCALGPEQRAVLLRKFRSMLADGGAVLLDVYSPHMFAAREESAAYARNLLDGFWAADEYFGFLNTFKYDEERLILDKYTIVERNRTRRVFNWLQCFTPAEIEMEFARCGLRVVERWGNVAGSHCDAGSTEFAVVARANDR
ncbi:MAG: class I SAM-dependent methyltransferase [Coriobacteriia bacterium]|nr:class I SAM-dependent methyltransferase [Coriobacteriia bacterium]